MFKICIFMFCSCERRGENEMLINIIKINMISEECVCFNVR